MPGAPAPWDDAAKREEVIVSQDPTRPGASSVDTPIGTLDELRALHALAEALQRAQQLEAIYPEILTALRWTTQADRVALLLFGEDQKLRFVAWHHLSEAYRSQVEGHSPWAANDGEVQPILVTHPEREPDLGAVLPALQQEGIASLAFIPVAHRGRLLGKFMLYFDRVHEIPPNAVRLALTVAEYLALAISRDRAFREVHQLKDELELRVAQRTRQLEEAGRDLAAFCHSISHDLRAPLRALDGFARILLEETGQALDPDAQHHLRRIIRASEHMGSLMDDLLKLFQIGREPLRLRRIDLGRMAREILATLGLTPPQRQVELRVADDLLIEADARLMRMALEHLLGNAWFHTAERTPARIEFGRRTVAGQPCLFVRDNGRGFDMKHAGKLFQPFHHVHAAGTKNGRGIGLALTQRIIERHGGRIWAESQPARGTTFFFTLWEQGLPTEPGPEPSLPPLSRSA